MLCNKRLVLALTVVALAAGCTSTQKRQQSWQKKGSTPEMTRTAIADCKYKIGLENISKDKRNEVLANCMEAKDYRWR